MSFEARRNLAMDSVLIQGRSVSDTAMRYGIRSSLIWEWLEAAEIDASQPVPKRLRQRLTAAERELHSLKIKIGLLQSEVSRYWSSERL